MHNHRREGQKKVDLAKRYNISLPDRRSSKHVMPATVLFSCNMVNGPVTVQDLRGCRDGSTFRWPKAVNGVSASHDSLAWVLNFARCKDTFQIYGWFRV